MEKYLNKKILILENFYPLQTRSLRIKNSLLDYDHKVDCILWNRSGRPVEKNKNQLVFTKSSKSKIKKLLSIYSFYKFIRKMVVQNEYDILIASHWDMLFLCFFLKRKNQKLIYDNLDMPTHNLYLIRFFFKLIEKVALLRTDGTLFASRFFQSFYSNSVPSIIVENKPLRDILSGFKEKEIDKKKIVVSFFGTLRYTKSLKLLMRTIGKKESIDLAIRGSGFSKELVQFKNKNNFSNVSLNTEWYNYEDLGKLFSTTDLIWAAYPSKDFNVKYAISNKFFECLVFNKPGIFAKNTQLGALVENNNLGFVVDPYDSKSIENLLKSINDQPSLIYDIKKSQKLYSKRNNFWEDDEKRLVSFILG